MPDTGKAQNINVSTATKPKADRSVDSTFEATASLTPELVIALCGPIGSPLHSVASQIKNTLGDFGYGTEILRLSELIRLNEDVVKIKIDESSRFSQISTLIAAGDKLREMQGNDILAKMAIARISADREKKYGKFKDAANEQGSSKGKRINSHRICHVIDSIKNLDELKLLRLIYGDALFAIGVFSPLEIRKKNLEHDEALSPEDIEKLIDTDSGEEFSHGQSVRNTFPQSDFFLRIDAAINGPTENSSVAQMVEKLRRFFSLLFRTKIISPTSEENAMYAAASAARNSACLSRQVGAAVTSSTGELLASGWNDVPRSGGGLYGKPALCGNSTGGSEEDLRCYAKKGRRCHNDSEKRAIANKIVETLVEKEVIPTERQNDAVELILKDSRVKDLIEFSRAVHAEMHAILGASRVAGERVVGGNIFVTTYPCHSCARHIVAAGISKIYYIEPYRKSLATRLHSDALTEAVDAANHVQIMQFDGVAPRRFIDLFEAGARKSRDGVLDLQKGDIACPSTHVSLRAIPRLEEVVVAEISKTKLQLPELTSDGSGAGSDE